MSVFLQKFLSLKLKTKFFIILLLSIILTTTGSLIGLSITMRTNNKLLYEAFAGSVTYSAESISLKLSNLDTLAKTVISNQPIKNMVSQLVDNPGAASDYQLTSIKNTVYSILMEYLQKNKTAMIESLSFCADDFSVSTISYDSFDALNNEAHQTILDVSAKEGSACWITDYSDTHGIYMRRFCQKIQKLPYQKLGTVVIHVDLDSIVRSSIKSIIQSGEVQYLIFDEGDLLYSTSQLPSEKLYSEVSDTYSILTIDQSQYFCIRGMIENNRWEYICMIPYTNVTHTQALSLLLSFILLLCAIILSFLIASSLFRTVTNDIDSLYNKMTQFSSNEKELPAINPIYENRTDEIASLHRHFDHMANEIYRLINENYVKEILTKDANLKALQSQINPHFLYNALESVNWRAKSVGAKDISAMVESLGYLLRESLSKKNGTSSIRHELQIVHDYLTIQQMRFGEERLQYTEEICEEILDAELPHMTIQPLIDNAINYAMDVIIEACCIETNIYTDDQLIHIKITNNGSQFEDDLLEKLDHEIVKPKGIGIGLLNIHKRIQIIYGDNYGLKLYNPDEDHATAEILIPKYLPEQPQS